MKKMWLLMSTVAIVILTTSLIPVVSAVTSPYTQTDWSTGDFFASSQVTTSTAGQITLTTPEKLTNPSFTNDISGWNATANAPAGWIEVPSNPLYNPPSGNFLVMQYEAKYDANGDSDGDTPAQANAFGACTGVTGCTADFGTLGLDYRDLISFDKEKVVSTANGAPLVHITQTQAISACPASTHLITNREWMTLVRNIEAQATNWANGTINSTVASGGGLKRGNVGITDSASYNGADPEYGTGRDTKAKHVLSNGGEIWDLSGNVWEMAGDTIMGADKPHNNTGGWAEWTVFAPPGASSYGILSYDLTRPANSSLNTDYGVGRYYEWLNTGGPYVFSRGGVWNGGINAGLFTLYVGASLENPVAHFSFRCASDSVAILPSYLSSSGRSGSGGAQVSVGSIADAYFSQSVNVGDTSTYYFSAYVYNNTAGRVGGVVDSNVVALYYGGNTITNPQYTAVAGKAGWYLLTGTVTGVASNVNTGLVVKKGKTVIVDDVSLRPIMPPYVTSGSLTSSVTDTEFINGSAWGTVTYNVTTPTDTSVVVKLRTNSSASMTGAPDFSTCTAISSGSDVSSNDCVTDGHRFFQYQVELSTSDELMTAIFEDLTLDYVKFDINSPVIVLNPLGNPTSNSSPPVTGTVTDSLGTLTSVEYQVNSTAGTWIACTADDGTFDSNSEVFTCTLNMSLSDGSHTIYVRATDNDGNTTLAGAEVNVGVTVDTTAPKKDFSTIDPNSGQEFIKAFKPTSLNNMNVVGDTHYPSFCFTRAYDEGVGLSYYTIVVNGNDYLSNIPYVQPPIGDNGDTRANGDSVIKENNTWYLKYNQYNEVSKQQEVCAYGKTDSHYLNTGVHSWSVKAVDKAGNSISTDTNRFLVMTNQGTQSSSAQSVWFPLSLLQVGNRTNLTTYSTTTPELFTKDTKPLLFSDSTPTFYGIAPVGTTINLTLEQDSTDEAGNTTRKQITTQSTTANDSSEWGVNLDTPLTTGTYYLTLIATNTQDNFAILKDIPIKLGNSVVATLPVDTTVDSEVLGANDQQTDWEVTDVTPTTVKQATPTPIAPKPSPTPQPKWWQFWKWF